MLMLLGFLKFTMLLMLTLIPVAIWQQTRITGFLLLAASYGFGAISEGVVPYLFARLGPDDVEPVMLGFRIASLLMVGLAIAGLWQVYLALRRPRPVAASAGEG